MMIKPITILLGDNGTGKTEYTKEIARSYKVEINNMNHRDDWIDTRGDDLSFSQWIRDNGFDLNFSYGDGIVHWAELSNGEMAIASILLDLWGMPPVLAIQNPEICLSPANQVLLTTLLVNTAKKANKKGLGLSLIIETHSEYVLDTIRALIAEDETDTMQDDVVLLYFEVKDSERVISEFSINKSGTSNAPFYEMYGNEGMKLGTRILKVRSRYNE